MNNPIIRNSLSKGIPPELRARLEKADEHIKEAPGEPGGRTPNLPAAVSSVLASSGSGVQPQHLPDVYYDGLTSQYYRKDSRGGYVRVKKIETYLKSLGYESDVAKGAYLSPLNEIILDIQSHHNLDYVGSLAGYPAGFYQMKHVHALVTQSPTLVVPRSGNWPLIKRVGENLFGSVQWPYVLSWLQLSLEMLLSGSWQAGQAFVMCGPAKAGKNLFMQIILALLGGRSADPYQYMTGVTTFNSDLFGAELLLIEDKAESIGIQARRAFGAHIKGITSNELQRCHRKYGDGQMLVPLWRIGISLNDDPERLLVLPPIDRDIEDKIMLFLVAKHEMPMDTTGPAGKKAFETAWKAEIPAFADYLLNVWRIPEKLKTSRFGVKAYHHSTILQSLQKSSPEITLLELIDTIIFDDCNYSDKWSGRSNELERELRRKGGNVSKEIDRVLTHSNSCGTYLGRLSDIKPERVTKGPLNNGNVIWTIYREGPAKPLPKPRVSPEVLARLKAELRRDDSRRTLTDANSEGNATSPVSDSPTCNEQVNELPSKPQSETSATPKLSEFERIEQAKKASSGNT